MKDASRIFALLVLLAAFAVPMARAQQAATVMGTVTDADTGEPLPGASILVSRSASGAVAKSAPTDANGRYIIEGLTPGAYVISASYVGYATVQQDVQLTSGQTLPVVFAMRPGEVGLNDLVVTASRRREKVLEAPASVSVLTSGDIEHQVTVSAVDLLKKTVGVDIARTGIDREEVVLRGFNNAFSGAAYVMTDYRQAAVASLGVNAYDMMPISNIDLDRIEVVRGPGSALYGPGVDAGVIHFITKSPFTYPGTTIAVSGGQRSFLAVQGRHAGVINDRIGYKITGLYSQAEDWHLDPAHDAMDAIQDSLYHRVNARNYDVNKANVNGTVEYRFSPSMVLAANAGYATAQSVFLSGIGTLQADGFGYTYGQLRLSAGDFFAQAYVNKNNAGNSFVYAGPAVASSLSGQAVMDNSLQYNAQAQYGVGLMQDRERITFGADYEVTTPRTNGTITGRNEGDDTIIEYGAYGQSETRLTNQLNLTLAARLDYDNVYEALQLSPRAAVVFTPTPEHSFRATYNRAFASPGSNSLFLDIAARDRVLATGAPYHLIIQARGAASGFTFDDYRGSKEGRFSLPVPNFFGQDFDLSAIPIVPIYGAAAAGGLVTYLGSPAPLPGPLAALTPQQRGLLANLLGYTAQNGSLGTSMTGAIQLGTPDEAAAIGYRPVSGPIDIAPLKQTVTQTVELGYKGLVANRLIVAIDGYWTQKKNFVGP
ncbi:MAG TPA: TonB-dependent receptor, partial [Rhodothermales bacterium]|nr:TonB-dependent receptor [Rhodothermales bacterium]